MGAIPLPQLGIQPPVIPNAQERQLRQLQMASLLQQQQTGQLQQEGLQQENELRAKQIRDINTAQTLSQDPKYITKDDNGKVTGFDWDGYGADLSGHGVGPDMLAKIQTLRKNAADTFLAQQQGQEKAIANHENINKQAWEKLEDFKALTDPVQRQQSWSQIMGWAQQNKADLNGVPQQAPSNDQLGMIEANLAMHSQAIVDAKNAGEARKNAAEGLLAQNKADMIASYKKDPQSLLNQVDSVAPPQGPYGQLNARTKFGVQQALSMGDVDGAKEWIKQAAEQVGAIEKETNPTVQANKVATAAAEGASRAATEINTKRQEDSDKQFATAIGADERLNRMEKSYTDAVDNHNQQAMLALLTDHIGMTLGLQKGARITKDIINEAAQSQPWLSALRAKFDSDGYLSGVNLSPGQMKQMLDLGYSARENAWQSANTTANMYGVKPPPNAAAVYNKRDPNARIYNQAETRTYQGHTYEKQPDGTWKLKQ